MLLQRRASSAVVPIIYVLFKSQLREATPEAALRFRTGSFSLDHWPQGCAKDVVPELASNAKAQLVVEEVMLEVILLELLVPQRKVLVVQEVVRHIVKDVAEDATAVGSDSAVPVPEDDGVREVPERVGEGHKERRRHDQAILVHWQVVVNAVKEEVGGDTHTVVRQIP